MARQGWRFRLRTTRKMSFLWPQNLWLMLALPLLPALYLWLLRRPGKPALRLSSVSVARRAANRRWRRHVPPALLLLALALLLLALARPTARLTLPWARSTIMLAIDVSLSMRVKDVCPRAWSPRRTAAKSFLHELPRNIDVGIVTFAGSAQVAQQATFDRPSLIGAIDAIQMQTGHRHRQRHRGVPGGAVPGPWHRSGRNDLRPAAPGAQPG